MPEKRKYKYPQWIVSCNILRQINRNDISPVFVSLLQTAQGREFLDLRVWKDSQPTAKGVYLTPAAAYSLIDIITDFIAGNDLDLTDSIAFMPGLMPSGSHESNPELN